MLTRIRLAGALALVVAVAPLSQVFAQEKKATEKQKHSASKMSDQFMPHVLELNAAEAEFGRLGMEKAQNPRVRDYAAKIAREHAETLETLGGLWHVGMRRQMTMTDTTKKNPGSTQRQKPTARTFYPDMMSQLSKDHQTTYHRLSKLSGPEFDREFLNTMVKTHQEAIEFFEKHTDMERAAATPDERRVYAGFTGLSRQLLPKLRDHLQMAQTFQREL